jgi:hypothetical protein
MQPNSTTPAPKPSHCETDATHLHSLDCGHNIIPSPITGLYTTRSSPKQPCSKNCRRDIHDIKPQLPRSWFKPDANMLSQPFICPACVEDQIRAQYPKFLEQHRRTGGKLTDNEETNVQLWTYSAVLEAVEQGGRMCEATIGIFRLSMLMGLGRWRIRCWR